MEGKTIKPDFERANPKKEKPKRNYSHKKLMQSLDVHVAVAKKAKDKKAMLDIKDDYILDREESAANRIQQRVNLRESDSRGFPKFDALERMEENEKIADQRTRNETMRKAKGYYHRNYSLSNTFKAKSSDKSRGRSIERE